MRVTLDGKDLFGDRLHFTVSSLSRASVQRSAAGLDGVVSIDLGKRGRTISQRGVLRATDREQLSRITEQISSFIDGATHTLVTRKLGVFEHVRMDSFEITKKRLSGAGITAEYEIVYMQHAV